MRSCMNFMNSQGTSIAYAMSWADHKMGHSMVCMFSKTRLVIWFEANHRLEHSTVQIMETMETILWSLNLHTLKRENHGPFFLKCLFKFFLTEKNSHRKIWSYFFNAVDTHYLLPEKFYKNMMVWKNFWLRELKNNLGSKLFKKCYQTKFISGSPFLFSNWVQFLFIRGN